MESSDLRAGELPEAPVSSDIYWRFKKKEGLEAFTVKKVHFRKCSPHLPGYSSTRPRPTHSAFLNS